MRVIAGRLRGRRLEAPSSGRVRPTYDRVRESVFAIIEPRLEGASVLDLFAGSGSLGIEALSRGAGRATFVEADAAVVSVVIRNTERLGISGECNVRRADVLRSLASPLPGGPFDVVFVDPPYGSGLQAETLDLLLRSGQLAGDALVVVERSADGAPAEPGGQLALTRTERYGSIAVDFYERVASAARNREEQ